MNRPNVRRAGDFESRSAAQGPNRKETRLDMKVELGLTDAQEMDIRKNAEAFRRARLIKTTDLKVASMDLKSLLRAEKVDEKAIAAKLAEVQVAQGTLTKLKVDSALAMKRILTPEQQKKMGEMRRNRGQARMNQRMNRGRGRMGQGTRMMPGRPGRNPGDDSDSDQDDFDFERDDEVGLIHEDIR